MPRLALIAAAAVLAGAAPAAASTPLTAKVKSCTTGLEAPQRVAVFSASMPRVKGASVLAMRFDLLERRRGTKFAAVSGVPRFGVWERSKANVAGFVFDKRVSSLGAPAGYRVRVLFRWYAPSSNRIVQRAERLSPVCEQPDLRPDLRVEEIEVGDLLPSGRQRYSVAIRNAGHGDVTVPTAVGLRVGNEGQGRRDVPPLAAGAAVVVSFDARPCRAGEKVTATVDLDEVVDEAVEIDDEQVQTCPGQERRYTS